MLTKSQLAIKLSTLKPFSNPKPALEQYPTDSEVAASILHNAFMQGDIEGKSILDLGAGTGFLGIGALLLGAKHVTFLEIDKEALDVLEENIASEGLNERCTVHHRALSPLNADVVIMNPPFGSQNVHADRTFLEAAMKSANTIYSLHLAGSEKFIDSLCSDSGFLRTHTWPFKLPLRNTMKHHTSRISKIDVICVRLFKENS